MFSFKPEIDLLNQKQCFFGDSAVITPRRISSSVTTNYKKITIIFRFMHMQSSFQLPSERYMLFGDRSHVCIYIQMMFLV